MTYKQFAHIKLTLLNELMTIINTDMKTIENKHFKNHPMKNASIAIASALLLVACSGQPQPPAAAAPQLPVYTVHNADATTDSEYPAALQGTVDIEIRPQVSGNLDRIFVDEGQYVTKGQPLFHINDQPYREQLNNALASLHSAEAAQSSAQLEIDKLTPLVKNKVVSDFQLKSATSNYRMATSNVEQAKAVVASARINLGYTTISASVNGYIGRLPKKQGSLVSPTDMEALTKLSDVHNVYAYFSLGETDFLNFKAQYGGNTLEDKIRKLPPVQLVMADDNVYTQSGHIDMVDGQFDKNTGAITMRAIFPNANGLLRSGNTGRVRLTIPHGNALIVPQASTIEVQDKIFVFAIGKDNKVTRQPIDVIGKSGTDYLIGGGIKTGDRIVLKGFENLQDGTVIQPQETKTVVQN